MNPSESSKSSVERTSSDEALRAQLVIPEQRELFDYWRARCAHGRLPGRPDIRPAELRGMLPCLSLLDVLEASPPRLAVRLAGTRLREYYGVEITGRRLEDLDLGDQLAYWQAAYEEVVGVARPAQGVITLAPWKRPGIFQFWLRLPLMDAEGRIAMVLGHDAFLHSEKARAIAGDSRLRIA